MKTSKHIALLAGIALAVLALPGYGQFNVVNTKLTPPGPPQNDVMKTLDMTEPRTPIGTNTTPGVQSSTTYEILRPGSYYLTENLMGTPPETGLVVYASNVTLDLNGFGLIGSTNSSPNNAAGILVAKGANFVTIQNGSVSLWQDGIISLATNLVVKNLQVHHNSFDGLRAGKWTDVSDSTFYFNLADGVELAGYSRVSGVLAFTNNYGIVVGPGSLVQDCVTYWNINHGIRLTGPGSRVSSCVAYNNNVGISVDADRCTVVGNTCTANRAEGIACGNLGSTFYQYCTVDGNHVAGNAQRGIIVTGSDNLIIRNVAYDNPTAYFVSPSNQVGTVVTAIDATGFAGSSGGNLDSTIGPWANFAR